MGTAAWIKTGTQNVRSLNLRNFRLNDEGGQRSRYFPTWLGTERWQIRKVYPQFSLRPRVFALRDGKGKAEG